MAAIDAMMRELPIPPDMESPYNNLYWGKYKWLAARYKEFLVAVNKAQLLGNPVKNRFRYFRQMIKNHYEDTP